MDKTGILATALILIVIAASAFLFFSPNLEIPASPFSITGGFTTLSLTTGTNYISSDPYFNSPSYTLAVVADGSSGKLRGTFTPSDVQAFTSGNAPTSNFDIAIDVNNETCTYTIRTDTIVPVYSYSWSPVTVYGPSGTSGGGTCSPQYSQTISSGCWAAHSLASYTSCGTIPAACANIAAAKIGDIYRIDSTPHYDNKINVSLITANSTYSLILSPTATNGEIVGFMKAAIVGGLQGTQGCPVPSSDTVLFRPVNTNTLLPKSITLYNQLYSYSITQPTANDGIDVPNSNVNQFINSGVSLSSYCASTPISGSTATYSCAPSSPVYIPLLKLNVKASVLGVIVPSGTPKIISISNPTPEAGTTTDYNVTLQNIGAETDSFDLSVTGQQQVNLQASRVSLTAGQTTTIPIKVQGAGIIGSYVLTATSVNDAKKSDSMTFKLKIDPYCDRPAEPGKIKTSTEFGCYYICASQYSTDLRDKGCVPFGSFETRGTYISLQQTGLDANGNPIFTDLNLPNEFHCTGIGQYASLIDYMNYVASPTVQFDVVKSSMNQSRIFVPSPINGAVWLPAPICNYVGEYGYHYENGQVSVVNSQIYSPLSTPAQGTLVPIGGITSCAQNYVYDAGARTCKYLPPSATVCASGSIYNTATGKCEVYLSTTIVCSPNAIYNPQTNQCELQGTVQQLCTIGNWDAVKQACVYVPPTLNACSQGTFDAITGFCVVNPLPFYQCPAGTTFNAAKTTCDITLATNVICLAGVYNAQTQKCEVIAPVGYVCQVGVYNSQRGFCEVTPPTSKICSQGQYNPNTDKCEIYPGTEIKCPLGVYSQQTGMCQITPPSSKVCTTGVYNSQTDKCEVAPPTSYVCTSGTYNAARGICEVTPAIGNVCLAGNYNSNTGKCEVYPSTSVVCPQGTYNAASARCEITPPSSKVCNSGFAYDATSDKCISNAVEACPANYNFQNGKCQPTVSGTCPENFVLENGTCSPKVVLACPAGYELQGDKCGHPIIGVPIIGAAQDDLWMWLAGGIAVLILLGGTYLYTKRD